MFDEFTQFDLYNEGRNLADRTRQWYRRHLQLFGEFCQTKQMTLAAVTPAIISEFLAYERRRSLKDSSLDAHYRTLHAFFSWAVDEDGPLEGKKNPVRKKLRPQVNRDAPRRTMKEDFLKMLAVIHGDDWVAMRDRVMISFLFRCGLRMGELMSLRLPDVDMRKRLLHIRAPKDNQDRFVPFTQEVRTQLMDYLYNRPVYGADQDVLWLSATGTGKLRGVLTLDGFRQRLQTIGQKAGVRNWNAHSFRHGFAMEMLNTGMEMAAVSDLLGHADEQTTEQFYAQFLTETLRSRYDDVQEKLDQRKGNIV